MRATVIVATAVCGLAISGCASKDKQPTATPSFDTSVTASAAPSSAPEPASSPGSSQGSSGGGGGPAAPTYPKSAKDYAQALLLAFGKNDKARVAQLAAQSAVLQLASHTGLDPNWTVFVSCQADGGSHTRCVFRNAHGDEASVRLANAQLGAPMAAVEALIDRTTYPASASSYATTFALAWQNGNTERMKRLSSATVVSFFSGKTPASGYQASTAPNGDFTFVTMSGLPAGSFSFKLRIANASLGKANAIVAASST
jgi:hypothetical protein